MQCHTMHNISETNRTFCLLLHKLRDTGKMIKRTLIEYLTFWKRMKFIFNKCISIWGNMLHYTQKKLNALENYSFETLISWLLVIGGVWLGCSFTNNSPTNICCITPLVPASQFTRNINSTPHTTAECRWRTSKKRYKSI